jgi:ER lumen protein retaining receptor
MMNVFRFVGDMCHILSIVVLLLRLRVTKNANGISVKTQELYFLVFVTRYLDLFTSYYSLYNTVMKILYIASTALIVYTIKGTEPFKSNYDGGQDSFLHWQFAVAPVAVIALITNLYQGFDFMEVLLIVLICLKSFCFILISFPSHVSAVVLGIFNLSRVLGNRSPADHIATLSRS